MYVHIHLFMKMVFYINHCKRHVALAVVMLLTTVQGRTMTKMSTEPGH